MSQYERAIGRVTKALTQEMRNIRQEATKAEARMQAEAEHARAMGSYWGDARTEGGFRVWEIAEKLQVDDAVLRAHELGVEPEVWSGQFPISYADALERPELYPAFCERFNIPPFKNPTP